MMDSRWVIGVVVALLTGGGWTFLQGILQARRAPASDSREGGRAPDQVDASILAVARARDELEKENARLRANAERDSARWDEREKKYVAEIDRLLNALEEVRQQLNTLRAQIREQSKGVSNE